MHRRHLILWTVSAALLAQQPAAIAISGNVKEPLKLTAADLKSMPRASVETRSDGLVVQYEGVWLHEVLKRAGAPSGKDLRGKALASYLLAEAKDGYQVVFSLAEFDPEFTDQQILVADTADGKPLTAAQGPFRLVAAKEKRGARSVRMLTRLEVVKLRE